MKAATILPTRYLNHIEGRPYQMALAHLVGVDKEYTEFYKRQSDMGAFVIMDNGVIEGAQQTIEKICEKALLVNASEIILPDVFLDSDATLESSYEALAYVREKYPSLKVMVVPQGKTMQDWHECAILMLDWDIDCIGIPKVLTSIGGRDGRLNALTKLKHEFDTHDAYLTGIPEIHLLGCWENPIECTMIAKAVEQGVIPEVRGVDSAIAYVYTRENMLICDGPRPSGAIHFDAKDADGRMLDMNIQIWEDACVIGERKVAKLHR